MKTRLEDEKKQILGEFKEETHVSDGDVEADFPEYGRSEEDNAAEVENYQSMTAVTEAAKQRLAEIEGALERIAAGTYGVTEDGQEIPENRLRANPAATTLVV